MSLSAYLIIRPGTKRVLQMVYLSHLCLCGLICSGITRLWLCSNKYFSISSVNATRFVISELFPRYLEHYGLADAKFTNWQCLLAKQIFKKLAITRCEGSVRNSALKWALLLILLQGLWTVSGSCSSTSVKLACQRITLFRIAFKSLSVKSRYTERQLQFYEHPRVVQSFSAQCRREKQISIIILLMGFY